MVIDPIERIRSFNIAKRRGLKSLSLKRDRLDYLLMKAKKNEEETAIARLNARAYEEKMHNKWIAGVFKEDQNTSRYDPNIYAFRLELDLLYYQRIYSQGAVSQFRSLNDFVATRAIEIHNKVREFLYNELKGKV